MNGFEDISLWLRKIIPGGRERKARQISVEFRYFDRSTCSRCRATDTNVEKTMRDLREALVLEGVKAEFRATKLPASRLAESNSVLINGMDVEEIVNGRKGNRETSCKGCSELVGSPCGCRAYTFRGKKLPHLSKAMIRAAIRKVAGMRMD